MTLKQHSLFDNCNTLFYFSQTFCNKTLPLQFQSILGKTWSQLTLISMAFLYIPFQLSQWESQSVMFLLGTSLIFQNPKKCCSICAKYVSHICPTFVQYLPNICTIFFPIFAQYLHNICLVKLLTKTMSCKKYYWPLS